MDGIREFPDIVSSACRFCQDRISHYKVPRHIRFVESFPSTVTGKVQKFAMRQAMIEEFARTNRTAS